MTAEDNVIPSLMENHVLTPAQDKTRTCNHDFVRFRDLTPELVNAELQSHTTWTDGRASVGEMLQTAWERGLRTIAITEHVRRDTQWFDAFVTEVRDAAAAYPGLCVHVGCEAKALDTEGGFDASDAILDACDIILGSVHRFPDGQGGFLRFADLEPEPMARMEFDLAMGMLRHAPIDVLSHPGGMYQRRYGAFPEALFAEMMHASFERGIAIEINTSYLVDLNGFLSLCQDINPLVSIGSDAHGVEEVGQCRDSIKEWFGW